MFRSPTCRSARCLMTLLRAFSAPVKLHYPYTSEQLAFIMSRDSDGFTPACQQLAIAVIGDAQDGGVDTLLLDAFPDLLADDSLDPAMVAETLRMPSENYLADLAETVDVEAIHRTCASAHRHRRGSWMTHCGSATSADPQTRLCPRPNR